MSTHQTHRQNVSRQRSRLLCGLIIAVGIALIGLLWWLVEPLANSPGQPRSGKSGETTATTIARASAQSATPAHIQASSLPGEPTLSASPLAEIEERFLASVDKQSQLDTLAEIAARNDASAVQSFARIFPRTPNPTVKEALIEKLGEIDADASPTLRISLLESALVGQPRNVRLVALDVLGNSDDPRAVNAIRRTAQSDADLMLRELATEMLKVIDPSAK